MTSRDMNYVLKEHLDFRQHGSYVIPSEMIFRYSYSASFKNQTETPIDLMNLFDINYILNDNKNLGIYDQNAIPSQVMACYSYPASLINQNEIRIELSC